MRSAQRLASPAEAGIFERMAKSPQDELAAVSKELADLTETTRIEWERAMGEGHAWTDPSIMISSPRSRNRAAGSSSY